GRVERKRELVRRLGAIVLRESGDAEAVLRDAAAWTATLEEAFAAERKRARERLAALYDEQPFYELDEIFRAVYARLEIPYLDRAVGAVAEIGAQAAKLLGWRGKPKRKADELKKRRSDAEETLAAELVAQTSRALDAYIDAEPRHAM